MTPKAKKSKNESDFSLYSLKRMELNHDWKKNVPKSRVDPQIKFILETKGQTKSK